MSSTLGSRLRAAREARGLTRSTMASRLGRSESGVALYEDGGLVPSSPVLALFAKILDLPLDSLVDADVRAVDAAVASNLGEGPLVPANRRAALTVLLAPSPTGGGENTADNHAQHRRPAA